MSSTAPETVRTARGATIGRALVIIGGALFALSSWLNWGAKTRELGAARTAYTIPAKFVIDSGVKVPGGGLSLGIVVLLLGVIVIASTFAPAWRIAALILGIAAVVTAALYVYQVRQVVHDHNLGKSVRDFISIGPYVAILGGILAVVGAVIALIPPGFWSSLTSEETADEEDEKKEKPASAGQAP